MKAAKLSKKKVKNSRKTKIIRSTTQKVKSDSLKKLMSRRLLLPMSLKRKLL